jgi:hypothetical protein
MDNKDKHPIVHAADTGSILYLLLHIACTRFGMFIILMLLAAIGALIPISIICEWLDVRDYTLPGFICLGFGAVCAAITFCGICVKNKT